MMTTAHAFARSLRAFVHPRCTWIALAFAAAAASAGCRDNVGPSEPTDRILFRSSRGGAMNGGETLFDVYRMNPDGSGVENLTNTPSDYTGIDLTPDRGTVVFAATLPKGGTSTLTDCPRRVWRTAADGTQRKPITSGDCSYNAHLSPSGARIAYQRGGDIHVSNLDGTGETLVSGGLPPVQPSSCGEIPRTTVHLTGWFDLDRVAFWRHICGVGNSYYIVDYRGESLTQVDASSPATAYLSPDHGRLAYMLGGAVWIRNADGSGARELTRIGMLPPDFSVAYSPWSPDGKRLYVITSDWVTHYAVNADDGVTSQIMMAPMARFNGWSPRGDRILWTLNSSAASNVYISDADGRNAVNLTNSSAYNGNPVWVGRR